MTSEKTSHSAEKHSEEEIIESIRRTQDNHDIPAVSSREAAKLLDYKDDYVTVKLNQMVDNDLLGGYKTGAGYIYWVPGEDRASGEVDVSSVGSESIEEIDPEDVSVEKARAIAQAQLNGFGEANWWQRQYDIGSAMMQASGIGFGIGIGILLTDSPLIPDFNPPSFLFEIGALLFVLGGGVLSLSALFMLVTFLGQKAVERNWIWEEPPVFK